MFTLTQQGSVSGSLLSQINENFAELQGVDIWVRPQASVTDADGSYEKPYGSLALARGVMAPGMVIGLEGVLLEEFSTPIINDVTIIGAKSNQQRQATTSGVPNGGGATWLSPAGGTGALLTVNGQGWRIQNIYFNGSATAKPCIELIAGGDPPATADASHFQLLNCTVTGADDGLLSTGQAGWVIIRNCTFFNFAGADDTAIKHNVGAGGFLWGWVLDGNRFYNNVNHIIAQAANWTVTNNSFIVHGISVTTTTAIDFTNGIGNNVMGNFIGDALTGDQAVWTGGTNDTWCNFTADDGVGSGVPN